MRLKPKEILDLLGFNIPEEGVEIEGHDAFFVSKALSLSGKTMSVDLIPDDDLRTLHAVLSALNTGETSVKTDIIDIEASRDSFRSLFFSLFRKRL